MLLFCFFKQLNLFKVEICNFKQKIVQLKIISFVSSAA